MNKNLAIVGAGGHGKVVGEIALLNKYNDIHFFDDKQNRIDKFPFTILGNFEKLKENLSDYDAFFVAIGDNQIRFSLLEWFKNSNANIVNLIHPKATVSKFSDIGIGTCVMANAVINPGTLIKDGVIINTSASIDHDCMIEDFAHISPNCSLSGNVRIGKFTHLGTGTSVHPGVQIGNKVKTGVGLKIYKDVLDNTIYKD